MKLFVSEMIINLAEQFHDESNVLSKLGNLWSRNVFGTGCGVKIMDVLITDSNKLEYSNNKNICFSYQIL